MHGIIIVIIIISFDLDQEIEVGGAKSLGWRRAGSGTEPRTLTKALAVSAPVPWERQGILRDGCAIS